MSCFIEVPNFAWNVVYQILIYFLYNKGGSRTEFQINLQAYGLSFRIIYIYKQKVKFVCRPTKTIQINSVRVEVQ